MAENTQRNKPIFNKKLELRNKADSLTKIVTVQITPWEFNNDGRVSKGKTLSIESMKLPYGDQPGKRGQVFLDAEDDEVKKLISEAYAAASK